MVTDNSTHTPQFLMKHNVTTVAPKTSDRHIFRNVTGLKSIRKRHTCILLNRIECRVAQPRALLTISQDPIQCPRDYFCLKPKNANFPNTK